MATNRRPPLYDPSFGPVIPLCRELPTNAGYLDPEVTAWIPLERSGIGRLFVPDKAVKQ